MLKRFWKKIGNKMTVEVFLINFLPFFMLLIFNPAEIFFANVTEFQFAYWDFAGYLAIAAIGLAGALTFLELLLPDPVRRILLSVTFGAAVAGYLQVMFWNRGLDQLGFRPEGYQVNQGRAWGNLIFWAGLILAVIVLAFWKKKLWQSLTKYLSGFLLAIQAVALVSLMLTADRTAYTHAGAKWSLSGEKQFTVSANQNIIVLILDYFSSRELLELQSRYPGSTEFLRDFTWYDNEDCVYFGTYPSLAHMLTGQEVDMSLRVSEWLEEIWKEEKTARFYEDLQKKNYRVHLYTPDTNILCGMNDVSILEGKFANLTNVPDEVDVFYKLLFKTMTKMAGYRLLPEMFKPYCYTDMGEYADVIEFGESPVLHANYKFYDTLLEKGLTADPSANYLIVQHLEGLHAYTTGADGHLAEGNDSATVTAKGCMVAVEEYLDQLKRLGVYDDAAILITADHGTEEDAQVLFFVKEPGETHEKTAVNHAPISHREFLPTLAQFAGLEAAQYGAGKTIHDFAQGQERARIFWIRVQDVSIPFVPCYTGTRDGYFNVYWGFEYRGGYREAEEIDWEHPKEKVNMVDSYF